MKNKYSKSAHISDAKIRQIIKHFSFDLTASKTAELLKISRPTINEYFNKFRQIIFSFLGEKNQKKQRKQEFLN
jgi:transposase